MISLKIDGFTEIESGANSDVKRTHGHIDICVEQSEDLEDFDLGLQLNFVGTSPEDLPVSLQIYGSDKIDALRRYCEMILAHARKAD